MSRYNLIDEKWIPARFPDGSRDELGIRDTLLRSKEIAAIEDPSPLVVAGLHRFLLAVLYRALEGPTDIDQARELFRSGWPHQKIFQYLEKWRDRFWLFDDNYPFGQNPHVPENEIEPWTKLTAEFNATSNKVLFDHTDTKNPGSRTPQECARWLISTMTFSISGGRGYFPSPSSNAIMCIPIGRDLYETLCYCLVPYPNKDVAASDIALWEREPETLPANKTKRIPSGYADLFTWQPRMIRLEQLPSGEIEAIRFVSGDAWENTSNSPDPMLPYKIDTNRGRLPVHFRENRGAWRDFDSLLPDTTDLAPLTIQNAIRLSDRKIDRLPNSILVLGLKYQPPSANVDFWRMVRFILPKALVSDRFIRTEIRQLLTDAENSSESLRSALRVFYLNILIKRKLESEQSLKKEEKKKIKEMVDSALPFHKYWSTLESHFHKILYEYTLDKDYDHIRCQWLKSVRETLRGAWEQHRAAVCIGDAWAIRSLAKAEAPIRYKLKELKDEIEKLEPRKEDA